MPDEANPAKQSVLVAAAFLGTVESIEDPENANRVQVRISARMAPRASMPRCGQGWPSPSSESTAARSSSRTLAKKF